MAIDWLTVGAQVVNFLLLVYLLQRFLYRPVLEALERRERRMRRQQNDLEASAREVAARAETLRLAQEALEQQRAAILARARQEADDDRRHRVAEAAAEVQTQRAQWLAQLNAEWEQTQASLARRLTGVVTLATSRALQDLADVPFEQAMGRAFGRMLARLSHEDRERLSAGAGPLDVVTAFQPDAPLRHQMSQAVREHLGREVRFQVHADVLGGVELRGEGSRVSWSIAEYIVGLEDHLAAALGERRGVIGRWADA